MYFTLVDFIVPPQISTSSAIAAVEGHRVVLHCNVTAANPAANVTWHSPTGAELQNTNGRILLPSVNRNQNGVYTCQASNGVGSVAIKTTYLSVNCKFGSFFHSFIESIAELSTEGGNRQWLLLPKLPSTLT